MDAHRSNPFDRATERDDESLHVLLVDRLDERIERQPRCSDDAGVSIIEERDELSDPVDGEVGEVALGDAAESSEDSASSDSLLWRLGLGHGEGVHVDTAESTVVVEDRCQDSVERELELSDGRLVLLDLEGGVERIDDTCDALAERRTSDGDEELEGASVEGGDGSSNEARDEDGEDLLRAYLHDLETRERQWGLCER